MCRLVALTLLLLLAGCSMEQPKDTSDPAKSKKWISYCRKQGEKSSGASKASWLVKAYNHADEAGLLTEAEKSIPAQVLAVAQQAGFAEAFSWALERGAKPDTHYTTLEQMYTRGSEWSEPVLKAHPETLPVFMSLAIDNFDRGFFRAHAEKQVARGFEVPSPLERTEFMIRYHRFIGTLLDRVLKNPDEAEIRFLISVTPEIEQRKYLNEHTLEAMQKTGVYVFETLADENLVVDMVKRRWPLYPVDFETLPFGAAVKEAFRAEPEYTVETQGLTEWTGKITSTEADLLLGFPKSTWAMLATVHLDELLEESIQLKSETTMPLIQFKAEKKALTQADYNEIVSWSLKHGNEAIFQYVLAESGELDLFHIDFAALAENQKLFEKYAPQILKNIYFTMDTELHDDGITLGNIKRAFGAENDAAGLWIVYKYNLGKRWAEATKGRTMLMDVCEEGNLRAARYLMEMRGESIRAETGYVELQMTIFGSNRPKEGRLSPIFFAAKGGNPDMIKFVARRGGNVNARSNFRATPLMYAVSAGQAEAVKMLIELGADVNAEMNPNISSIDLRKIGSYDDISTAYNRAVSTRNKEIQQILLDAGARP